MYLSEIYVVSVPVLAMFFLLVLAHFILVVFLEPHPQTVPSQINSWL